MPANTQPIFPLTPVIGKAALTTPTALAARTRIIGTTGLTALLTAGTNGTRVDKITAKAKGNTAAGSICIWHYDGANSDLVTEIVTTAVTASATVASYESSINLDPLVLPANHSLYVSTTVQQDFTVIAYGGNY